MNTLEFRQLQIGDSIRHKNDTRMFIITANFGDRITAVATVDLTNPFEWERAVTRKVIEVKEA